jgi:hypothetical protein
MIGRIVFGILLCSYLAIIVPFSTSMLQRPIAVKLGGLPEAGPLKVLTGDQRYLMAEYATVRVLFYYGTLVEMFSRKVRLQPEYRNMFQTLQTASRLDPWNADVYYFTQAAFTWELNKVDEVNALLKYGMAYRTWDYQLPFWAGFNAAYFKKDYAAAAPLFKRAAELSGHELLGNLTARYFYEAGENRLALNFIETMQKRATDANVVAVYETRKRAIVAVMTIQEAIARYRSRFGKPPSRISDLTAAGILKEVPQDPYRGTFYLDEKGAVRSTSKFAFGADQKQAQ